MKVIQEKDDYALLRFEKGETFPALFESWLIEKGCRGAFFYGIGGATTIRCGYYALSAKQYQFQEFSGDHLEILHISGNVSSLGDHLKVHAHVVFSTVNLQSAGGHLDWLEVGATLELFVQFLDPLRRREDKEVGLALLENGN